MPFTLADSFVQGLLLENPWPLVATLVGVGLVLLIHGNQRANKREMIIAAACLAVAGGVYLLARVVTTDRETLLDRTQSMVDSTRPLDMPAFRNHFAPRVTVSRADGSVWITDASAMFGLVERVLKQNPVSSHEVMSLLAEDHGNGTGRTELELKTKFESMGDFPLRNRFVFAWTRNGQGQWQISNVQWVSMNDGEPQYQTP